MKLNVDLDPHESVKVPLKEEGTFSYTVKEGKKTNAGTVIVSDTLTSSGVGIVQILPGGGLQAPEPLIIRKNRILSWTNLRSARVKVRFG